MEDQKFISLLLRRYINNKASQTELEALQHLMQKDVVNDELSAVMAEVWDKEVNAADIPGKKARKLQLKTWRWISAAAVLLIIGAYFTVPYYSEKHKMNPQVSLAKLSPILPGKNIAVITLSNGKTIQLSSAKSGIILGSKVLNYTDGSSVGAVLDQSEGPVASVSTPRGGTYQVTLNDGSKVQLNAASSITFNTNFDGLPERSITLSGEAYFEVAKRKSKPFVVITKNQTVRVLGTHFNISAYAEDPYSLTTLLEGSVKINDMILKPNEQARQTDGTIIISQVDAQDAIDWKNGEFIARNESLENLMKKISRWYDVDISYENSTLKEKTFSGSLSRYAKVDDLLNALKFYGINSRLKNRKIFITN